MKVGRKSTGLALVTGAALMLSACGGEGDADPSAANPATTSVSSDTAEPADLYDDPDRGIAEAEPFAVDNGGYIFTLPDGGTCSIDSDLNDRVGSDFACLLRLDEPIKTEDGNPTQGLEFRDDMFIPSQALADEDLQSAFTDAGAEAERLEPASRIAVGGFEVVAEGTAETAIMKDNSYASFFVAEQKVSPFWTPRPSWVPEPELPQGE
ncbi:hypothetical protein [Corynebacterium glyciniphilum]|uniref:hypothetical protein n=1 Tax=Corynebacterium glyciniphilum TaxID=1404244 RepID=UPI003FD4E312